MHIIIRLLQLTRSHFLIYLFTKARRRLYPGEHFKVEQLKILKRHHRCTCETTSLIRYFVNDPLANSYRSRQHFRPFTRDIVLAAANNIKQ